MNDVIQRLGSKAPQTSALGPGLWIVGMLAATVIPSTPFLPTWAAVLGWILLTIAILSVLTVFVRHSWRESPSLRSEEFALKSQAMRMIGDNTKGNSEVARILSAPSIPSSEYLIEKEHE